MPVYSVLYRVGLCPEERVFCMIMRKLCGVVFLSMGTGVFIVLVIPGWAYLLAIIMIIVGFWHLFLC